MALDEFRNRTVLVKTTQPKKPMIAFSETDPLHQTTGALMSLDKFNLHLYSRDGIVIVAVDLIASLGRETFGGHR